MTKPQIQVRRAGVEDAADVARLLHDFNTEFETETPGVAELTGRAERMLREEEMVVLLAGEEPLGLSLLRFRPSVWSEQSEAYLQELYVVPRRRGAGIGQALLEATIDLCREQGADRIDLNTGETDIAARGLYEKLGFTNEEGPEGTTMLFYEREI